MFSAASVCLFVNTITSKQLSRPSLNVKVKCQGHRGQKNEEVEHFVQESSPGVRSSCGRFFGSGSWGHGYAGWTISACCLVTQLNLLVHGQVTIIFVVSVGLSVCLFVQSFFQLSLIRFRSN